MPFLVSPETMTWTPRSYTDLIETWPGSWPSTLPGVMPTDPVGITGMTDITGMTNAEIEAIYRAQVDLSHAAGLRAVYDAGYFSGSGGTAGTGDPSSTDSKPTSTVKLKKP